MVHHKIKAALDHKSEHALRVLLMRLWLISSGKARKRIQRMIMSGSMKHHKSKHKRKKRSGHPQRRKGKKSRRKISKAEAKKRFLEILPKINAGRRKKGLKPIRIK